MGAAIATPEATGCRAHWAGRASVAEPAPEAVHLAAGQILGLPDEPAHYVYFPRSAVVSLLVPMQDGSAVEGAMIGNEGLVGLEVFVGPCAGLEEAVVQVAGEVGRLSAAQFRLAVVASDGLRLLLQR